MSKTHDTRFADSEMGRLLANRVRRPRALLLADVYLVVVVLALARMTVLAFLNPGFLSDPNSVPPFVVDAALAAPLASAAFVLPGLLAIAALLGTRRPGTTPWSWTHLAAAWLLVAFAEWPLASADFTAAVLLLGAIPAVCIGTNLTYLREVAGQPWESKPWTRRRSVTIAVVGLGVAAFVAVYLVSGVLGMDVTAFKFVLRPGMYSGPFAR